MRDEPTQEGKVGRDAHDLRFHERVAQTVQRLVARLSVGDELCQQGGIVGQSNFVTFLDAGIDADAFG